MSTRMLLLLLALVDGMAALAMIVGGQDWRLVLGFLGVSFYLFVGIDRNAARIEEDA